jgi:Phospholipase_D-nuclease N-terminal
VPASPAMCRQLLAATIVLALLRQEAVPNRTRVLWTVVVLVVPLAGPIAYFAFGRSPIQPRSG